MAKEIKIKITLDGSGKTIAEIDDIGDSLSQIDKIDAKNAKRALDNLDKTTLNRLQSEIKNTSQTIKEFGSQIQNVGQSVTSFGQQLTVGLTLPIAAVTALGLRFNATKEQALVSFGVLLKSTEKAKQLFGELAKFAADTPFEMPEISTASKSLLAFGVAQEKILPTLKSIGDISSGLTIPLTELAEIYGKVKVQGRLFGDDINQLTGRGIPIIQELAKQFGVSESEVKKLVESGKVGFPELEKAFTSMTGQGGQFSGMMQAQSKTFSGQMSTLADAANTTLGQLTEPLFNFITANLPAIIVVITQIGEAFTKLSPAFQIVITVIAGIAAAIGPVLVVIGTIISFIGSVIIAIGAIKGALAGIALTPVLLTIAATIAVVVAAFTFLAAHVILVYEAWKTNFGGIRDFTNEVWTAITQYIEVALAEINNLVNEVGGEVIAWWQENYPLIQQTVANVSAAMKSIIQGFLTAVRAFWQQHGEQIMATVRAAWNIISNVVKTFGQLILQTIKLVMQIINGDWSGAWATFKDILWKTISSIGVILKNLNTIIAATLRFILSSIVNVGKDIFNMSVSIGKNLLLGLISGMNSLKDRVISTAKDIIMAPINIFRSVPKVESPSKVTIEIGEFIVEGLIVGFKNKRDNVKNVAKQTVKDALGAMKQEAAKAKKEFEDLLGSSFEKQQLIVSTADFQTAKSNLETLIKLRAELGLNVGQSLPSNFKAITDEIDALNKQKQGRESAIDLLKDYENAIKNAGIELTYLQKAEDLLNDPSRAVLIDAETAARLRQAGADRDAADAAKKLADARESILKSGFNERNDLQAQREAFTTDVASGNVVPITDEVELERIKRAAKWREFANENKSKYSAEELENLRKLKESENELYFVELQRLNTIKDIAAADKFYSDLMSELNGKMQDSTNLSEAARVAKLLETEAYKKLTDEQRDALIVKAQEVDLYNQQVKAAEEAKKKMEEIYNGLSDSIFKVLSDSVRGGFKAGLQSAFEELKNFGFRLLDGFLRKLSDKLAQTILNKIFGGNSSGGGGFFGNILQTIFGAGGSGGGIFSGNSGGGIFHLGSSSSSSSSGGLGGALNSARNHFNTGGFGNSSNSNAHEAIHSGAGRGSGLAGGIAVASLAANILGGLIGGRTGNVISMAGTGLGMGFMFGGPIGAAIGAGVGALVGLFMGDPKRRIDKKENMPKLSQGFADAIKQLKELAADKNALFNDPDGTLAKAMAIRGQIASGFGIQFQSKKYKGIAAQQIATKLVEADEIIKSIRSMSDMAKIALDTDKRLETNFATGVYMSPDFLKQFGQFKRRNGMLNGRFTGRDTLPSMLGMGEMVLNPMQIARVKANSGFDPFANAGIPNYATGTFVTPSPRISATAFNSSPTSVNQKQPINITIVINNQGIVESDIIDMFVDGMDKSEVQTKIVKTYDKGKARIK